MLSRVTSCQQLRAQIRFCQVKSHVQAACESHDLNVDLSGFQAAWQKEFYARMKNKCKCKLF